MTPEEIQHALNQLVSSQEEMRQTVEAVQRAFAGNAQRPHTPEASLDMLRQVFDALPEHVAVVDANGIIVMVNAAWRRFAARHGDPDCTQSGVGTSYLKTCESCDGDEWAEEAYGGIRAVLVGDMDEYAMEYPCHSATKRRWFTMLVAPLRGPYTGAVASHFDITDRKLAQVALAGATGRAGALAERVNELETENERLREQLNALRNQ